eukprot:tig00020561_g11104.t1
MNRRDRRTADGAAARLPPALGALTPRPRPQAPARPPPTREAIAALFHLPVPEAARALSLGATTFKRLCREAGIARWPHRKLDALARWGARADVPRPPPAPSTRAEAARQAALALGPGGRPGAGPGGPRGGAARAARRRRARPRRPIRLRDGAIAGRAEDPRAPRAVAGAGARPRPPRGQVKAPSAADVAAFAY